MPLDNLAVAGLDTTKFKIEEKLPGIQNSRTLAKLNKGKFNETLIIIRLIIQTSYGWSELSWGLRVGGRGGSHVPGDRGAAVGYLDQDNIGQQSCQICITISGERLQHYR